MAIKIIHEPDVFMTEDEAARYRDEYRRAFSHYSGTPPSFESFCRSKKRKSDDQRGGVGV